MKNKNVLLFLFLLPTSIALSQNPELIKNGDFSQGNKDFTSYYYYCNYQNCLLSQNYYAVGTDASQFHPTFYGKDHTTGTGNFMIVNGGTNKKNVIWAERVAVTPNTTYHFSCWISALNDSANNEELLFGINKDSIAPAFLGSNYRGMWNEFIADWYSDTAHFAIITIFDKATFNSYNDFGLDDISLKAAGNAKNASTLSVYPNPVSNALKVNYQSKTTENVILKISDAMGMPVQQKTMKATAGNNAFSMDVSNCKNGLYYIEIISAEGTNSRAQFMIKN